MNAVVHISLWVLTAEDRAGLHKGLSILHDACQALGGHVAGASARVLGEVPWDGNGPPCRATGVLAMVRPHGPVQWQPWHIQRMEHLRGGGAGGEEPVVLCSSGDFHS